MLETRICNRCGHEWGLRYKKSNEEKTEPKTCPKCKSPYWDKERKRPPFVDKTVMFEV